jgi:hypothetical protein
MIHGYYLDPEATTNSIEYSFVLALLESFREVMHAVVFVHCYKETARIDRVVLCVFLALCQALYLLFSCSVHLFKGSNGTPRA